MLKRLNLTDSQKKLKSELEILQKLLSDEDASRLYDEMAKKAHELL